MCEVLEDHEGSVSIVGNAKEEEAGALVERPDTTTTRHKIEI